MRYPLVTLAALLFLTRCYGADALTVIDLAAPAGQLVESAPIQIPLGYSIGFVLYSSNDEAAKAANQGVRLNYPQRSFTIVEAPPFLNISLTNFFTNSSLVRLINPISGVIGPATFSVFASNAVVRAVLYVQPLNWGETHFLDGLGDKREITVPPNTVMKFRSDGSGLLPTKVTVTTPTGLVLYSNPPAPWKPFVLGGTTYSNQSRFSPVSSAMLSVSRESNAASVAFPSFFYLPAWGDWLSPNSFSATFGTVVGPANVIFSTTTNNLNATHYGAFAYEILPANMSYKGNGTGGTNGSGSTNTNPPATRSFTLQLQRSTNLSDWTVTDNYYINETASNAFYRLKPVAQ